MMPTKQEKTDYSVLAPITQNKLKKQQKNLLGYLKYRYIGHSEYRANNDDWFFVSDREMMSATGIGSFSTLHIYLDLFIGWGIIEKITGSHRKSNMYRFTEAYKDRKFDFVSVENSSTEQVNIEIVGGECVAPMETIKCSTDTDSDSDKDKEEVVESFNNTDILCCGECTEFDDISATDESIEYISAEPVQQSIKGYVGVEMQDRRHKFWLSWDSYKSAIPSLDNMTAQQYYTKYISTLTKLYDGNTLRKYQSSLEKQYRFLTKSNDNNNVYLPNVNDNIDSTCTLQNEQQVKFDGWTIKLNLDTPKPSIELPVGYAQVSLLTLAHWNLKKMADGERQTAAHHYFDFIRNETIPTNSPDVYDMEQILRTRWNKQNPDAII